MDSYKSISLSLISYCCSFRVTYVYIIFSPAHDYLVSTLLEDFLQLFSYLKRKGVLGLLGPKAACTTCDLEFCSLCSRTDRLFFKVCPCLMASIYTDYFFLVSSGISYVNIVRTYSNKHSQY